MKQFDINTLCNHMENVKSASVRESWRLMKNEFYRLLDMESTKSIYNTQRDEICPTCHCSCIATIDESGSIWSCPECTHKGKRSPIS